MLYYPLHINKQRALPIIAGKRYLYGHDRHEIILSEVDTATQRLPTGTRMLATRIVSNPPINKIRQRRLQLHPEETYPVGVDSNGVLIEQPSAESDSFHGWAHPTEYMVASLLGLLSIRYEYEPHLFRFDDGSGFRPDFYLPDLDYYVELTVSGRKAKSKKMRRMAEEYPTIRIVAIVNPSMFQSFLDNCSCEEGLRQYLRSLHHQEIALQRQNKSHSEK